MPGTPTRGGKAGEACLLTVHGPRGVLDLTVPTHARFDEVAAVYAEQARTAPPQLHTRTGALLEPGRTLADERIRSGTVLVAVDPHAPRTATAAGGRAARRTSAGAGRSMAGPAAVGLAAALLAALAGWAGIHRPEDERLLVGVLLGAGALIGCLPFGRAAGPRVLAAPVLGAAACFVLIWDPLPERLPTVLGATALGGAVIAALANAWTPPEAGAAEGLRTWIVAGAGWFVVAALAAFAGVGEQVVWAVLLALAVLAARIVPALAVDVPDDYLLDLERLAVNAWSARERPAGKRGRVVVPSRLVIDVAHRGARTIDAAAIAIAVVTAVAAPLLLSTANLPLDRVGARCMVGFGAGALLLAAREYRHRAARVALRVAGLICLALLAGVAIAHLDGDLLVLLTLVVVVAGFGLVTLAVAVGRGWRSAWWSRRAEVAEVVCGAFCVGSLVVAVGLFRWLWEVVG